MDRVLGMKLRILHGTTPTVPLCRQGADVTCDIIKNRQGNLSLRAQSDFPAFCRQPMGHMPSCPDCGCMTACTAPTIKRRLGCGIVHFQSLPLERTIYKLSACGGSLSRVVQVKMKKVFSLVSLAILLQSTSAHSIFQELYVNGVSQGHLAGIRVPDYDGPITDVTSNDVICNGGINPYHQPVSTKVISVAAGTQVTAEWHHTLDGAVPGDTADPIDASHKGPLIAYLAKVPSATQSSVTGLQWFKIYQDGLDSSGKWGVDRLIANKGKLSFSIPSCIAAGQYLLRVEIIALHAAQSYPGAQLYMECAQLQITGGGSTSPATVSFPGAYKGTDPGIKINIYSPLSGYTVPGPSVFSCNGQSNPPQSTNPPQQTTTTTSTPPTTTTSAPPTTTSSPSGSVAHYGQCGGLTYSGPTACVSPYTCVYSNDYYSQCL